MKLLSGLIGGLVLLTVVAATKVVHSNEDLDDSVVVEGECSAKRYQFD